MILIKFASQRSLARLSRGSSRLLWWRRQVISPPPTQQSIQTYGRWCIGERRTSFSNVLCWFHVNFVFNFLYTPGVEFEGEARGQWLAGLTWPLQGSTTLLRGGPTGFTISPTLISFSSRSTALSDRRSRATSRSVTHVQRILTNTFLK